jgi:putative acetyltransferase
MSFTIRPISIGDGKAINELRRMPGVFETILGIPSERSNRSEEFIAGMDGNSHHFVAVTQSGNADEILVGTAGFTIFPNPRLRHSASLGIMVHRDYQGQGAGTQLMAALIDLADNWLMLVRIELTVYTDNETAIALYKKFGFEIEGIKKKAAIRGGTFVDEYIMARIRV